ncbi:ribosome biogenesis regulatory protein [Anaeramoeba flamelloides]|uniref:Ribosome biogenesis regulatory protein n=1 Tax=Anaeramoeba flamelloides TaxID=1746091 RepID=A0AAV7YFI7_9EUKA|nr:ribosome biogenesis regulatory protein [Anaeramoeba flamelloides]
MDVTAILKRAKKKKNSHLPDKADTLEYDLGSMLCIDGDFSVEKQDVQEEDLEEIIKKATLENTQLLLNKIFHLETTSEEAGVFVKLPHPTTKLPRTKKVPQPKKETRWEKFAKERGIRNKKKSRLVYDEEHGDWRPRYGSHKANNEINQWIIEKKDHEDLKGYEDPFIKMKNDKKKRVIQQRANQIQNTIRNEGGKITKSMNKNIQGILNSGHNKKKSKKQIDQILQMTQRSTASLGKFDKKLSGEPIFKSRQRRKFQPNIQEDAGIERKRDLNILDNVLTKDTSDLNLNKAVNRYLSMGRGSKKFRKNNARQGRKGGRGRGRGRGRK